MNDTPAATAPSAPGPVRTPPMTEAQSERLAALPAHIEETVAAIAHVQIEHHRRAGPVQRLVASTMARFAKPGLLLILAAAIVCWVALNLALHATGATTPDPPPFNYLATAVSVAALLLSAMILISQRHDDELATHRDQLTLQLAILSEKKTAKIIELLEAERQRDPARRHHHDDEAAQMATPSDPHLVLEAIKATQGEAPSPPPPRKAD